MASRRVQRKLLCRLFFPIESLDHRADHAAQEFRQLNRVKTHVDPSLPELLEVKENPTNPHECDSQNGMPYPRRRRAQKNGQPADRTHGTDDSFDGDPLPDAKGAKPHLAAPPQANPKRRYYIIFRNRSNMCLACRERKKFKQADAHLHYCMRKGSTCVTGLDDQQRPGDDHDPAAVGR